MHWMIGIFPWGRSSQPEQFTSATLNLNARTTGGQRIPSATAGQPTDDCSSSFRVTAAVEAFQSSGEAAGREIRSPFGGLAPSLPLSTIDVERKLNPLNRRANCIFSGSAAPLKSLANRRLSPAARSDFRQWLRTGTVASLALIRCCVQGNPRPTDLTSRWKLVLSWYKNIPYFGTDETVSTVQYKVKSTSMIDFKSTWTGILKKWI